MIYKVSDSGCECSAQKLICHSYDWRGDTLNHTNIRILKQNYTLKAAEFYYSAIKHLFKVNFHSTFFTVLSKRQILITLLSGYFLRANFCLIRKQLLKN